MRTIRLLPLLLVVALSAAPTACRSREHAETHGHEEHGSHDHEDAGHEGEHGDEHASHESHAREEGRITVDPATLQRLNVTIATAGRGSIDQGVELLGEIHPNGDRLAHITPRFAGLVVEVRKAVGDPVKTGDVLAVIESSESLSPYTMTALLEGTIIEKHITRGEAVDRDRVCFVVADLSTVWVDLSVYQRDLGKVSVGQTVRVRGSIEDAQAEGTISYLTPGIDRATRTASARIALPNPDGRWRPGMFVTAVALDAEQAELTIPAAAIQNVDGNPTAFVVNDGSVEARTVRIGRRGDTTVEILGGIEPGARVVASNSFLFKAELGKSEAEHAH